MKRAILIIIFIAAAYGSANAFVTDGVDITEAAKDKSALANQLMRETAVSVRDKLRETFPCLNVSTKGDKSAAIDQLRRQQLVGPKGDPNKQASAEEETAMDRNISDKIKALGTEGKYFITIVTTGDPLINIRVSAYNSQQKNKWAFYNEDMMFQSKEEAMAGIKRIADELVNAFVKKSSKDRWDNEVCPFKGKVDVTVITKRNQHTEDTSYNYCNGADQQGKKSESFTAEGKQLWQLKRIGNPDTWGTMDYTLSEKFVKEEVDGCHACSSGRKGPWHFKEEVQSNSLATGLDTSTYIKGVSDNKDATVRLHFSDDGTYTIVIKASSLAGKKYSTRSKTAEGTCDNSLESETKTVTFTEPLMTRLENLKGAASDKKLTEKKTLRSLRDEIGEEREIIIDFELERP